MADRPGRLAPPIGHVQTFAQIRMERKRALRAVRLRQREMDSAIERMERRIFALLRRKTVLTVKDAKDLNALWNSIGDPVNRVANTLADFNDVVSS